jgi:putative endonuclease
VRDLPYIKMKDYFVYILVNESKTVLYTGVTSDLIGRLIEHKTGAGGEGSFTGRYGAIRLLHYERFTNAHEAIAREKEIKGWRRDKKVKLIETQNPFWKFLDEDMFENDI